MGLSDPLRVPLPRPSVSRVHHLGRRPTRRLNNAQLHHGRKVLARSPVLDQLIVRDSEPVTLTSTEALSSRWHHPVDRSEVRSLREDPNGHSGPLRDHRFYGHVQIGKFCQYPYCGSTHSLGSINSSRSSLCEGRDCMFNEILCHDLVTDDQVLSVEDLLEVSPNTFLLGLRHGSSLSCPPQRRKHRHAAWSNALVP